MNTLSRVCLGLGIFLAVAGGIYGVTSHEKAGTTEFLVGAVTFFFLSFVMRFADRQAAETETAEETEVHVAPTIWPFGFAIAGVVLAVGFIVSPWILVVGGVLFALCSAGWLRDVSRSHAGGS